MKTVEEIIASTPEFHDRFSSAENVLREFEIEGTQGVNILFASYGGGCYEGDAFVLFEQGGTLWEANGNHCSCFGLEGQWSPEHVVLGELQKRATSAQSTYDEHHYKPALAKFLGLE